MIQNFQNYDEAWSCSIGCGGFVYHEPNTLKYYVVSVEHIGHAKECGWVLCTPA